MQAFLGEIRPAYETRHLKPLKQVRIPTVSIQGRRVLAVIGQGYVGLPLAIASVQAGHTVFGLDHNESKISLLISGHSIIEDLADDVIKKSIDSKLFLPTIDENVIS